MKVKTVFLFCFLLLWQARVGLPLCLEDESLDSWVYPYLEELHTAGLFTGLHKDMKPYSKKDLVSCLREIRSSMEKGELKPDQEKMWLIEKLEQKFKYELEDWSCNEDRIRYGIDPSLYLYQENDSASVRFKMKLEGGIKLGDKFLLRHRAIIDNQPDRQTDYLARKWKRSLVGMTDEAYGLADLKYLKLLVGREPLVWGPSLRDNLLLSGHFPALDMVRLQSQIGSFRLVCFATILDPFEISKDSTAKRYFSGHRINWKSNFGLELGLSEVVVYGGTSRTIEPYYLNPLLSYYAEQFNNGHDDNPLWGMDFDFVFKSKELYGELLLDDFQYDLESEPNQIGYKLGFNWYRPFTLTKTFLNLEYTRINRWVYGQNVQWNIYTYHKVGMGSFLGPDADDIFVKLSRHLGRDFFLSLSAEYKRKGQGRIDEPQKPAVPFPEGFPSGTVEYTKGLNLSSSYQPNSNLQVEICLNYRNINNYLNLDGIDKDLYQIAFKLNHVFLREKLFSWKK